MPATLKNLRIRWLVPERDMAEIARIEGEAYQRPCTEQELEGELLHTQRQGVVAYLTTTSKIVGFAILEMGAEKVHVRNVAVARKYWRRGVGSFLLGQIASGLRGSFAPRWYCTSYVDEYNVAVQKFFHACGWLAYGVGEDIDGAPLIAFRWPEYDNAEVQGEAG